MHLNNDEIVQNRVKVIYKKLPSSLFTNDYKSTGVHYFTKSLFLSGGLTSRPERVVVFWETFDGLVSITAGLNSWGFHLDTHLTGDFRLFF